MNRRIALVALAAAVVSGVLVAVLPQHAVSIVRIGAATLTAVTAALVLTAVAPVVAREPATSALDQLRTLGAPPLDPHGLRDARRDLDRPTAPGSVPPAVRTPVGVTSVMASVTTSTCGRASAGNQSEEMPTRLQPTG